MTSEIVLLVNGRRYLGWESVRVTQSIESLAGSFTLDALDRWGGQGDAWPIIEEDSCQVAIGDDVVISGHIDKRSLSFDANSRSLSYSGRDKAAALVDCSAIPPAWSFRNLNLFDFAALLAKPFGIRVSVQPGLHLDAQHLVVQPGESVHEAIQRGATAIGVLVVSDGMGGIRITRAGTDRAAALVEGENVKSGSVDFDGTERFHRYLLATQAPATDEASGEATRVKAEAFDPGVRRTERMLMIRPDKGYSTTEARRRADWEARIRAARSEQVTISVQGWRQPGGDLWRPNLISTVRVPSIGVFGDMLISQVEFSISGGGSITQLQLVRPDAFTPEPEKATVKTSGGRWKELDKGGL